MLVAQRGADRQRVVGLTKISRPARLDVGDGDAAASGVLHDGVEEPKTRPLLLRWLGGLGKRLLKP